MAEQSGFKFIVISDHFHPWVSEQGQSPFVWSVLGGIAQATERVKVGTAVTCPIMRIHPAIIAHAAATVADMMPNRFFLEIGRASCRERVLILVFVLALKEKIRKRDCSSAARNDWLLV